MNSIKCTDEIIEKAFALAYFIQGNRAKALSIVLEALGKLEVASAAQVKRLYYVPTRRSLWQRAKRANHRTKVTLSDLHLLQRLIYVESEPYEKEREQMLESLDEEELIIHFIKYLVRISIKRNSFYVTLGISRLLHNYSTTETMEIYNVVVQDPERVKDDYYYRSRKARLIQEIKERFRDLVNVCRGPRGEERFQTQEAPEKFSELVAQCLSHFSPWQTPCLIPMSFNPTADELLTLSSANHDEEDKVEINRIHAVVHPDCYGQIARALKLEPPVNRLGIPRFILPNGKNDMNSPNKKRRRPTPALNSDEVESLKRRLVEQSGRRKTTHASLLAVVVDKVERARIDLRRSDSISFRIDDAAELVEVIALDKGDETLLATHLMSGECLSDITSPAKSEIVLEGGQKLTFELSSEQSGLSGDNEIFIAVSYRETEWLRAASLSWQRLLLKLSEAAHIKDWHNEKLSKPVLASLLLMLVAGVLALYALRDRHATTPAQIAVNRQPVPLVPSESNVPSTTTSVPSQTDNNSSEASIVPSISTQETINTRRVNRPSRNVERQESSPTQAARQSAFPGQIKPAQAEAPLGGAGSEVLKPSQAETGSLKSDATRSVDSSVAATALSKVRKVFLDILGDHALSEQTSQMLTSSLQESQRLTATKSKDEADAALKLFVSESNTGDKTAGEKRETKVPGTNSDTDLVTISARLVNEDGAIIWPTKSKDATVHYTGTIKDVTSRIVKDLLKDIRKSDTQK